MIDLFIIAEVRLYREGLAWVLSQGDSASYLRIVKTAAAAASVGTALAAPPRPVVLLDTTGADCADAVGSLRDSNPHVRIIVLGISEDEPDVIACAEAGVAGYVTCDDSLATLLATIVSVARGELACSPRIAAALNRRVAALAAERRSSRNQHRLSSRELEIVRLIDQGMSNREIAHRLYIELATVKNHVHNILDKLDVPRRTDAAAWARSEMLCPARDDGHS